VKPFSAKEMIARVEATLRRSREAAAVLDAVKSERRRLQALFEQAPAFIAVLRGPDHVYEAVNPECLRLIGRKDVVGKSVREVLGHRTNESRLKVLDDVYRTGVPYVANGLRFVVEDDNGTPREIYLNLVYQPMFEDGAVTGIFAHGVDVTAHIRALEEVETANRAKLDFLRSMSHELRTPLNAIGGYIQLIEMGVHGPINDAQREALVRVHRSQQHLLSLINDVLNFAKVEAGRVEYDLEPLRLADAVVDVIQMLSPQAKVRGITLERSIDAALSVIADREKLEQIMLNLLSNALKFTPPGGRVTFTAERSTGDQTIALHVSDTGIGIDAEKLEAIFDPFVQVKRDLTNTSEGTGLGLAISRDLARGMNGDLTAASIVSEGSTFTLTLPAA
jgi:PAS domain S-box-containing protein